MPTCRSCRSSWSPPRPTRKDVVAGLDAGADEYLTKPVDQAALVARVTSMLRHQGSCTTRCSAQAAELAGMEPHARAARRASSSREIERMGRLQAVPLAAARRADRLSAGDERVLESHRREVTVVFCDLRGFTAFAETAEPGRGDGASCASTTQALGALIHRLRGHARALRRRRPDGALQRSAALPGPCAARRAAWRSRCAPRSASSTANWRKRGHELGFGIGIAQGYATLGRIGFEGRFDYAAIGTVANLAARLCAEAKDGQILIDGKVKVAVEAAAQLEPLEELRLKGFHRPIKAFNVRAVC